MTVFRDRLDARDLARLAELHLATMPRSLVSRLGPSYAQAFYRYVAASPVELLCLSRGQGRILLAASVISLDPAGIERRLLWRTPLLLHAARRLFRLPVAHIVHELYGASSGPVASARPELLLIFVDPAHQGEGLGSRLLKIGEDALRERGFPSYRVATEDQPDNRALRLYGRNGFRPVAKTVRRGTRFQVFEKWL